MPLRGERLRAVEQWIGERPAGELYVLGLLVRDALVIKIRESDAQNDFARVEWLWSKYVEIYAAMWPVEMEAIEAKYRTQLRPPILLPTWSGAASVAGAVSLPPLEP